MPEAREKFDLDFGIEDTTRTKGETALIDAVFTGGTLANPDDVQDNDDEGSSSSTTGKTTTKAQVSNPANKSQQKQAQQKPDDKGEEDLNLGETVLGGDEGDDDEAKKKAQQQQQQQQNQDDNTGADDTDKSSFANLAEDFIKLGMFQTEEGEELNPQMTPEEFVTLYHKNKNREINDTINGFLGRFGEDYREMFDAVFVNGVDPRDYLNTFTKLTDIASLDMQKPENQEKVYAEYLRRQGFSQERIEAKLQKAKAQGDLEEDSTDFHKILVEQDAETLQNLSRDKEQKTLAEKKSKVAFAQAANKLLVEKAQAKDYDGIPVTEQIARETFQYMTEEKYRLPSGEPLTEFDKAILELRRPENAALKVKLALLLKNGLDLTKVKVKEKNEETKQAFQWATKGKQNANTKTNTNKGPQFKNDEAFI